MERRKRRKLSGNSKAGELDLAKANCRSFEDPPGFDVRQIDSFIGEGVFTTKDFAAGVFLLEYKGDLVKNLKYARRLEKEYQEADLGSFMYFFKYREKYMCVDATNDIFYQGKGDEKQNCEMKIVEVDNIPHLCLFSTRNIAEGEELRYDYGVSTLPWRKKQQMKHTSLQKDNQSEVSCMDTLSEDATRLKEACAMPALSRTTGSGNANQGMQTSDTLAGNNDLKADGSCVVKVADSEKASTGAYKSRHIKQESQNDNNQSEVSCMNTLSEDATRPKEACAMSASSRTTGSGNASQGMQTSDTLAGSNDLKADGSCVTKVADSESAFTDACKTHHIQQESQNDNNQFEVRCMNTLSEDTTRLKEACAMPASSDATGNGNASQDDALTEQSISDSSFDDHDDSDADVDYKPIENSGTSSDESEVFFTTPDISKFKKTTPKKSSDRIFVSLHDGKNTSSKGDEQLRAKQNILKDITNANVTTTQAESKKEQSQETKAQLSSENGVHVPKANNGTQRRYDKRYFCMFCEKPQSKLTKHLVAKHREEDDVIKYMTEEDKNRKLLIYEKIRNVGNHLHNIKVIKTGHGELAVTYRPRDQQKIDPSEYGPCPYCYAYYQKKDLWRHNNSCKFCSEKVPKRRLVTSSTLLMPRLNGNSDLLVTILEAMKKDDISRLVKSDSTIISFGEKLCFKRGHDKEAHNYIRQKLRELGRLLQTMRKNDNNSSKTLEDFMYPEYYKYITGCCKEIAGFDYRTNTYATPSLALKIGGTLQKCLKILTTKGIENGNHELQKRAEELSKLFEFNWTDDISSNALRTLNEAKRNNKGTLPLANDVKCMTDFLRTEAVICAQTLNDGNDELSFKQSWTRLSEICLCQTILFNRRRPGEVSKMTLDDFNKKQRTNNEGELDACLSPLEKELCKSFNRTEILAKRGRIAPVLFSTEVQKHIELLTKKREQVINPENKFLFPTRTNGNHIRGTDVLRVYSEECGAEFPERLRATQLRKHIATMTQLFNLSENEIDILANFLGHDIRVHREFYRLPQETLQVAKVSKLLLMMESGKIGNKSVNSLDDIEIEDEIVEDEDIDADSEPSDKEICDAAEGDDESETIEIYKRTPKVTENASGKRKATVTVKRSWSEDEKAAVKRHLERFLILGKLPGKRDIEKCKEYEPILEERTWKNIKDFCRNTMLRKNVK